MLAVFISYVLYLFIWLNVIETQLKREQYAIYLIAFGLALGQALWHIWLIRKRQRDDCFKAFRLNHWLGLTVFAGIAASYAAQL